MSERRFVDTVENFRDGERRLVDVDGQDVCVIRYGNEYHAFQNYCPHRGGPVGKGEILPAIALEEEPNAKLPRERYGADPVISCPWHGWDFWLESGEHCGHSELKSNLVMYDVTVEDGQVYVLPADG